MKKYFYRVFDFVYQLESKIAFYPSLLSLAGLLFALFMSYAESQGISKYLVENAPTLVVNNTETARSLLTTFIAGLISIMVFSFSMVMILLNQASSNYSPRVLPGLISNRRHQIILGIYNSCLLYCIFTLVSVEPTGDQYQLPGFSVLLGIIFMTLCLGAFIYFIHSISQEIQINIILDRIFTKAKERLSKLIQEESDQVSKFPNTSDWPVMKSKTSGYYQNVSIEALEGFYNEKDIRFKILPVKGSYLQKEDDLLAYEHPLDDDDKEKLYNIFHFSRSELIEDNYVLAFKQITEVAIKAMSPGINDPGTAINAIDYLTELFLIRLQKNDDSYYLNEDDEPIIAIRSIDFEILLFNAMAALRTYCKHDIVMVQKLFAMLRTLKNSDDLKMDTYSEVIENEMGRLNEDAREAITNSSDLQLVESLYQLSCS